MVYVLNQEKSVLSYLSEEELESLREMSLGKRVRFLRERMDEIFAGGYSIKKIINRIKNRGISVTPMAMYQLESDRIHSPKSLFLMGVAQELGVSMEFLLQGPTTENDPGELEEIQKQSDIRFGLRALQKLET